MCRLEYHDGRVRHTCAALCGLGAAVFADGVGVAVELDHVVGEYLDEVSKFKGLN